MLLFQVFFAFTCRYGKLLIAANLKDAETLMPHLILQLAALLVYFPQQSVYLSIYESGSSDSTGRALQRSAFCKRQKHCASEHVPVHPRERQR